MTAAAERASLRKIVIAEPLFEPHLARLRQQFPEIQMVLVDPPELASELGDADAVVAWNLNGADLGAARRLRWFQTISAGVDDQLLPEFGERNILVTNNSGVCATNIAEHLMAMMLAFARRLPHLVRGQLVHEWRDQSTRAGVFELKGQTVLVVGLGDIGLAFAERASAFGMKVVGVRRRRDGATPRAVAELATIDDLGEALAPADHVAICLPLTARTRHLFDADLLGRIKPSAYLYNIGRGGIVDTTALIEALRSGRLAGAGLDVTDPEPLPSDSPLWEMENVLITAHTSGGTPRHWDRATEILETNIARFQAGKVLVNLVDLREGY